MHQDLSDRTFRYRIPPRRRVGNSLAIAVLLAALAMFVARYVTMAGRLMSAHGGSRPMPPGLTWIIFWAVSGLAVSAWMVRRGLVERRLEMEGEVQVTRVSLVSSPRAGQADSIFWDEVEELRVPGLSDATAHRSLLLDIRGAGKRVRVPSFVEENQLLRELIIQRAGLTERKQTFLGTRFLRPGGEGG